MKLERLLHAYEIIDGIPEEKFDLSNVITSTKKATRECGTIACAAGWLSLHPDFQKHINAEPQGVDGEVNWIDWTLRNDNGRTTWTDDYAGAMAHLFGIEFSEARKLFGTRLNICQYDPPIVKGNEMSDKELWLYRVRKFLKSKGKLR